MAARSDTFVDSHVLFDFGRSSRIGLPEAVFCEGKTFSSLKSLLSRFGRGSGHPVLFTRLSPDVFGSMPGEIREAYDYDRLSRTAFGDTMPEKKRGSVAIVSAGTADGFVTFEAARTLTYLGVHNEVFEDCGVAGLWRLTENLSAINACDCVIVVAGLDAALLSVAGGLISKPLFGVPTSVGYGAAEGGKAALASMLASCAPGVCVLNIDNGYGAACAAARVIHVIEHNN